MKLNTITKSLTGALVAGAGALQTAASDGVVTSLEWGYVAAVTLVALGLVWAVPNADTRPQLPAPPAVPTDRAPVPAPRPAVVVLDPAAPFTQVNP